MMQKLTLLVVCLLSFVAAVSFAGTLVDDFEDGDMEGWKRSPQNEDNDNIFWGIEDGAMKFDPKGEAWDKAISQVYFAGTPQVTNVAEWTDYEVDVDIKLTELSNYPGGIRARVDPDTGAHYVVWLYPGNSNIKLYKNPGWDINTALSTLGEAPFSPKVDEYHTVGLKCEGDVISVLYDGKEIISAKDGEHKAGTIALGSQNRAVYFDNVTVTGKDVPNVQMSPVEPVGKLATKWGALKRSLD